MDKTALQRHDRIGEYRKILGEMKPDRLAAAAREAGVSFAGDETREEMEFAIAEAVVNTEDAEAVRQAQEDAATAAKAEREAFYRTKEGKAQRAIDEREARENAVRRVNHGFVTALPHSARMQGTYQPDPNAPAADHPVPDGRYRVSGSLWVMEFKGGKWTSADLAHSRGDPDWAEIPDVAGAKASVRPRAGAE